MKIAILFVLVVLPFVLAAAYRGRRAAYELPAGYKDVLKEELKTTFRCNEDGYYADADNNCQVFHICHTVAKPSGRVEMFQWSFFCNNLTVFNQDTLTCTYPEDAPPCGTARSKLLVTKKIKPITKHAAKTWLNRWRKSNKGPTPSKPGSGNDKPPNKMEDISDETDPENKTRYKVLVFTWGEGPLFTWGD